MFSTYLIEPAILASMVYTFALVMAAWPDRVSPAVERSIIPPTWH